jgi:hypothetical protein
MLKNEISNAGSEKGFPQEILDKIKDLKPKPRWQFLLKDYFIWFLAVLALLFSSLALAVIMYMLVNNDWDVYRNISNSLLEFIFLTLPYFWLVFLGIFILITHYNFRHTKKGYKFSLSKIFLLSLVFNIFLGTFLYNIGLGQAIDNLVARNLPFYKQLINKRQHIWSNIDEGFLGGVVMSIDDQEIKLRDIEGNIWIIKHFNTSTPGFVNLQIGQPIRIIGQKIDSQNFEMYTILPMRGMRWMNDGHRMPPPPMGDERKFLEMRSNR